MVAVYRLRLRAKFAGLAVHLFGPFADWPWRLAENLRRDALELRHRAVCLMNGVEPWQE